MTNFTITSMESLDSIFIRLALAGGWPTDKKYLLRAHGCGPVECKFHNEPLWNDWWSVVCSVDDYLWWCISDEWKDKFRNNIASNILTTTSVRLPKLTERLY